MKKRQDKKDFMRGLRKGVPVALGYLCVSFTFGVKAVYGGIPSWIVIIMSLTNLTSAGQFAGATLIMTQAGFVELAITTFVINIRYMLMSIALSQKTKPETGLFQRLLAGFGITDEVFAVAASEPGEVSAGYMHGLIFLPIIGWTGGTALGAIASQIMPVMLSSAMELGLYAMFIAIIIPPARANKSVALVIAVAIMVQCVLQFTPVLKQISVGFRVTIATVIAAVIGAIVKPVPLTEEKQEVDL